jgi:DNA or RNA helicases of superfamily II
MRVHGELKGVSTVEAWLEALVADQSDEASVAAIAVLGELEREGKPDIQAAARRARVIKTTTGEFVSADPQCVFEFSEGYRPEGPIAYVAEEVFSDPQAQSILMQLGIGPASREGEIGFLLASAGDADLVDWVKFWDLARDTAPESVANEVKESAVAMPGGVRVKTLSGLWHPIEHVLLPGPIVPSDGSRDAAVTIDTRYHERELGVLDAMGALAAPAKGRGSRDEPWFTDYLTAQKHVFYHECPGGWPQESYLMLAGFQSVGPLTPLMTLCKDGKAAFTSSLLNMNLELERPIMYHRTRREFYGDMAMEHPCIWMLRKHGVFDTSLGVRSLDQAVGPQLAKWRQFLPVIPCAPHASIDLGIPVEPEDMRLPLWRTALQEAFDSTDNEAVWDFYAWASGWTTAGDSVRCAVGQRTTSRPPGQVAVTFDSMSFERLRYEGTPAIVVSTREAADRLVGQWGMMAASEVIQTQVDYVALGDPIPLGEEFPVLEMLRPDVVRDLVLVRCDELRLESITDNGKTSQEIPSNIDGATVYWCHASGDEDLIDWLNVTLGLQLMEFEVQDVLAGKLARDRAELIDTIRSQPTDAKRFLAAVEAHNILRHLPQGLAESVEAVSGELDDDGLGNLAMSVYGIDVLHEFRQELADRGLRPPSTWGSSRQAKQFVQQLGFPEIYAGFQQAQRDRLLRVDGSPTLPPLHEFQRDMAGRVRGLLSRERGTRGLLSLPTGAGKTRVAVQAIVEQILDAENPVRVLWVAQTDELCEQAVQTWSFIWRAMGPQRPLAISRLWSSNEAEPEPEDQVVVSTIAKLDVCMPSSSYDWLFPPDCLVIDEAHAATTPSYTQLLHRCGLERDQAKDSCVLLGLTATPYRGVSVEETKRLATRFGTHRVDEGILGDEPYAKLQELGILARVKHMLIPGSEIRLTDNELQQLRTTHRIPASVEDRVARDVPRNQALVDAVCSLPGDWTVLLFAASVLHAQTLAALLNLEGVSSAAVSSSTDPRVRRHYVSEFRKGKVRVLTNYGVFAEGFDAPAVRAVFVARPTYSPNRYQQMVGRGLRGPLNGGKEECLIGNVKDTIAEFGEELAFTHFDYLWQER